MVQSFHQGSDRYSVAFPDLGMMYIAEVEWTVPKPARMHSHLEHQFLFVLDGTMILETQGKRYEETSGALFVMPAGQLHSVFTPESAPKMRFIDLRLKTSPPVTLAYFLLEFGQSLLYLPKSAAHHMALGLRNALERSGSGRVAHLHSVLWEALSTVRADHLSEAPLEPGRVHLRAAENAMKDRLTESIGVPIMARAAGLSRSQLTRLFHQHLGLGPAQRLRQIRIEKACELLRSSTLSIKEIAHACGFVCPNHFCRVFRKATRATPTTYRTRQAAG